MSEVKIHQPAAPKMTVASSAGTGTSQTKASDTSQLTQVDNKAGQVAEQSAAVEAKLQQAVAKMNDFVQSERRDLSFSIDEATGSTVVQVTDGNSGELIRQIPNELFLRLAQEAKEREEMHLIDVRG